MRVADRSVARNYLKHLHRSQAKYQETNQKIASGNRFTKLSDDVSAGSRVLRSRMERYKAEKQLANTQEANSELKIAEDNLMSINQILTIIHEDKAVRALNDPTSDYGRQIIAGEIESLMVEFLQHANASYGNMFPFGATNAYAAPFTVSSSGKMLYNGIDMDSITRDPATGKLMSGGQEVPMNQDIYFDIGLGIRMSGSEVNEATAFKLSFSGPEVFGWGVDEDGLSNNIYNVLFELKNNLEVFDRAEAEKWNTKLRALMDGYRSNLTDIGTKTNFLDAMEKRLKDTIDNHTERIHQLMGVDDAEEATHQMMNDYVLKAVLQMGSMVLPLSLMDFIR